jgi:hypothetical protein
MWLYQGPSYPDRPSYEKLVMVEVDARIDKVLDLRLTQTPEPAQYLYREVWPAPG